MNGGNAKWVYLLSEGNRAMRDLLGGKGANMAEMRQIGIPVPPAFTVTTAACNAYLSGGEKFPEGMWEQEIEALHVIERETGKVFGDPNNPLLVSCRSGAKFSMPGMMDTILNIGLNDSVAANFAEQTQNPRFVYDSYRRLIQMFGSVVMEVPDEPFEEVISEHRQKKGFRVDSELQATDWQDVILQFKEIVRNHASRDFPQDPIEQLRLATEAVFKSWNGKRANDYRNAAKIPHDLGTAVNIVAMVFGNMGNDSGTGVAMSRNASTGEPEIEGDYLLNAQGEDVVAGIRATKPIAELKDDMPQAYTEFVEIAKKLEQHYKNMQDMEFTVEKGKLWILQTRDGKRTAQAEVRIAVDQAKEGLISKEDAVRRVKPEQIDFFLHPQLDAAAKRSAQLVAKGLNVSPGAAVGIVAFSADLAQQWAKEEGKAVIMVRPETKPDDVHGMLAAKGVLTSRGGRTSHAALVARQFGKPAVVGVSELEINQESGQMKIGDLVVREGDWISLDGTTGEVYLGQLQTVVPDFQNNPHLMQILTWCDEIRRLQIWANADYAADAKRARQYGAQGIGLCRTEHMFFETERLPIVQQMIMAKTKEDRGDALAKLLPMQRADFKGLFREMAGLPVIIRLIDPPLHEFLPAHEELLTHLLELKFQLQHASGIKEIDRLLAEIKAKEGYLERVSTLKEANPMLGLRGVRLGITIPELTSMQVRAIIEAACICAKEGLEVYPEVMIPLTCHVNELKIQQEILEDVAKQVLAEQNVTVKYKFGTMIEVPRAALTADELAQHAQFFSFGTNDLTQTTFGISRDDAEASFLVDYIQRGILKDNPFATIDKKGLGKLMDLAVKAGKETRPDLEVGICGEHGGDPESIALCHQLGLNYVSCSPFRIPIARLAAAHAALGSFS